MREGVMGKRPKAQGEGALGERASPLSQEPLPSQKLEAPSKSSELLSLINLTSACSVKGWGI